MYILEHFLGGSMLKKLKGTLFIIQIFNTSVLIITNIVGNFYQLVNFLLYQTAYMLLLLK